MVGGLDLHRHVPEGGDRKASRSHAVAGLPPPLVLRWHHLGHQEEEGEGERGAIHTY